MPSASLKQHNLMKKVAASKDFADKVGIKQSVAREFLEADKKAGKYQYPKPAPKHKGWYLVEGYPYFLANREGKIKNAKTGYETFGSLDDKGYRRVCQWDNVAKKKKEYKAHHIVCTAFEGPCPGPEYEVGHKDHNRGNNRPGNLHWTTRKSNMTIANKRRVSTESEALGSAYVGRVPDEDSTKLLQEVQEALELENPIPADELHITLLYSESQSLEDYEVPDDTLVSVGQWELLHLGDDERIVAIKLLDDKQLQERHEELLEMGGKHSYPDLMAHVSLSYDDHVTQKQAKQLDWDDKRYLAFVDEYLEPIQSTPSQESVNTAIPASMNW